MTLSPLRREVEPPRRQTGPLMPLLSLGSTSMLTLAMALAVMTPSRERAAEPEREPRVAACDLGRSGMAADPAKRERDRAKIERLTREGVLLPLPRPKECKAAQRGVPTAVVVRAVNAEVPAFAACMREWAERTDGAAATMTVAFQVTSSGAIDDMAAAGLDDRHVPTCLATAIRQLSLPAAAQESHFQIELKYVEGQTRIATTRLDCDPR